MTGFTTDGGVMSRPSIRAQFVERRTYLRPLDEAGTIFETPKQALDRVIGHQRWLWEKQIGKPLDIVQEAELAELRSLVEQKKVCFPGRVRWMGGTDIIKERGSAAFNCSFTPIETPADIVDAFWLLLQGVGVGFKAVPGLLTGLPGTIENVVMVPSLRTERGGAEHTRSWVNENSSTWTIKFGDSARGWAKGVGNLVSMKPRVKTLVLDFSELRPGGQRLRGYGWLSSGWEPLMKGMKIITDVMQRRGDSALTAIDVGDTINALGTVLSSRRSAEIWLYDAIHTNDHEDFTGESAEFVDAKVGRFEKGLDHREMSNNSLMFYKRPTKKTVVNLLHKILLGGDPGIWNAAEMKRRAPEAQGTNPCGEILLPPKGFCNLIQVVWHRFNGDYKGLVRAQYLAGRANYRQTCVSMKDGVLQLQWNDNNKLLRLCGVSPTGFVAWEYASDANALETMRASARLGADSMADELRLPRARRVTQVQPAGTGSKTMGIEGDEVHEGAHLAQSRFSFNNVNFSIHDPIVEELKAAGYRIQPNPTDETCCLVTFPVAYPNHPLYKTVKQVVDGVEEELVISSETALDQLKRYKMLMDHYVENNVSITVSFDEHEIEGIADWLMENWDSYVGIAFLRRNNPTLSAEDLGFKYLPQQAVSKRMYDEYVASVRPVDLARDTGEEILDFQECAGGACPIR